VADLVCRECNWFETSFQLNNEIKEYIEKTELIVTDFNNQECPNCGKQSTEVYYVKCLECGEAEPDCSCDLEDLELTDKEADKMKGRIMDLVEKKFEEMDVEKEQERLAFKRKDLRRMAARLIEKQFAKKGVSSNE